MGSYYMWFFVIGFSPMISGHTLLQHVLALYSFLGVNNVPSYGYTAFYLPGGHLVVCFLAVMNNAAISTPAQAVCIVIPLGWNDWGHLEVGHLEAMCNHMRSCSILPRQQHRFTSPPAAHEASDFSNTSYLTF